MNKWKESLDFKLKNDEGVLNWQNFMEKMTRILIY